MTRCRHRRRATPPSRQPSRPPPEEPRHASHSGRKRRIAPGAGCCRRHRPVCYAASALAPSTRKAYEHDWRVFATWCAERGLIAIPAEPATVAAFLAAEADRGFRPVTVGRRAAAIAAAHRAQDKPNPCDSGAVAGVSWPTARSKSGCPLRSPSPSCPGCGRRRNGWDASRPRQRRAPDASIRCPDPPIGRAGLGAAARTTPALRRRAA